MTRLIGEYNVFKVLPNNHVEKLVLMVVMIVRLVCLLCKYVIFQIWVWAAIMRILLLTSSHAQMDSDYFKEYHTFVLYASDTTGWIFVTDVRFCICVTQMV